MAGQKINDRTALVTLTGAERLPVVYADDTRNLLATAQQIANLAPVQSVNGEAGAVVLDTDDVGEGATNLYLTTPRLYATLITESTTARTVSATDAHSYIRFTNSSAKTYTFTSAEMPAVSTEILVRNVGAGDLTLVGSGVTLNADYLGTLVVPQGGTVAIKIVGATEADVMGATVAA